MAITFNSAAVDGGSSLTGIYAHIVAVDGPKKTDADADEGISESWHVTYGVVCHKDASTRALDNPGWPNRIPAKPIDRFKWSAANLGTYPTMAVLYSHLKTEIASIATSIADA